MREVSRNSAWTRSFEFTKKDLETILERYVLPAAVPELPTVRRMILGMNSSLVVPSLNARATVERQLRELTDHSFIEYSAAVYFHTCEIKINSWTTEAKKMRGSMPPKFEVRDVLRTLEEAGLEKKLPIYDDRRMIVEEGHMALKDDIKFAKRKYRAPYGLEELELGQEGERLDAAGPCMYTSPSIRRPIRHHPQPWRQEKPPCRKQVTGGARKRASRIRRGKAWMKPLVKQEKRWRWETHLIRAQWKGNLPRRNYCRT